MSDEVGYLGPGTVSWGYIAAEKYFNGQDVKFTTLKTHPDICKAVAEEKISLGVVAVENVLDGVISETVRAVKELHEDGIRICGEIEIPIRHFLFRNPNNDGAVKIVASHQSAIRQCSRVMGQLRQLGITTQAVDTTAAAAELSSKNPEYLAICSDKAEGEFGLVRTIKIGQTSLKNPWERPERFLVSEDHIGDNYCNFTRFWVVGTKKTTSTGKDKTCFLVGLDQSVSGGLCKVLRCFAERKLNLLIVLPIPIFGRKWEYNFLLEYSGHIRDQVMQDAYEELKGCGACIDGPTVFGSYPVGSYPGILS
ncbi:hypothetical protein KKE19_01600 [Patescibacteria group bacterium]|nr:hypothetical protein [Patescibacteria group bacterium]MBU4367393.1 hypothetical protein [Patescibacteria group bacterium]MBU4461714.1 hypothetical protein [Patescibacteria group bacterium]MCG2700097.1 hypothetical protein [Candidatus Parcubacteria bacterium]